MTPPGRFSTPPRPVCQVAGDALADTIDWLQKPEAWDHNGGEGPFVDKRLARVAFTAALATAVSTGRVKDRKALLKAADQLALDQAADGSWPLEGEDATGAPATYGRPLATLLARESLAAADPARFRAAIDRADAWLEKRKLQNVTDASVSLLGLAAASAPLRRRDASVARSSCSRAPKPKTAVGARTPFRLPSPSTPRSPCWPSRSASRLPR